MNIDWRDFTYNCQGSSTQSSRWVGWLDDLRPSPLLLSLGALLETLLEISWPPLKSSKGWMKLGFLNQCLSMAEILRLSSCEFEQVAWQQ